MTSVIPFRTAAAGIATSANRNASQLTPHGAGTSLSGPRREVPLPSEEGTKGVVQYALYATPILMSTPEDIQFSRSKTKVLTNPPTALPSTSSPTGPVNPPSGP